MEASWTVLATHPPCTGHRHRARATDGIVPEVDARDRGRPRHSGSERQRALVLHLVVCEVKLLEVDAGSNARC